MFALRYGFQNRIKFSLYCYKTKQSLIVLDSFRRLLCILILISQLNCILQSYPSEFLNFIKTKNCSSART